MQMMRNAPYWALIISALLLTACSKGDEMATVDTPKGVATVTFLVTPNGLGDNGYNDAAAGGICVVAKKTNYTATTTRRRRPFLCSKINDNEPKTERLPIFANPFLFLTVSRLFFNSKIWP